MFRRALSFGLLPMCGSVLAAGWTIPPDKGYVEPESIAAILSGNDYPSTSGYRKIIEYVDFDSYGQQYTQVVVTLTPDKPRLHNGRKLVVVGGEPGSEYAMDFLETPEGKEGPGIWLAKRGVTFVALTRVGRWNFFAQHESGSWHDIPLGTRMPIFNRQQKAPWFAADFDVKSGSGKPATSGDSDTYRFAKSGTALYSQMLAATPNTYITGYRKAIEHVLPQPERSNSFLLYWGMSTGGAFMYPLANYIKPDGFMGWGTSSSGLAYVYRKAKDGDFSTPYTPTALRLRERGLDDFKYYTKALDDETPHALVAESIKRPALQKRRGRADAIQCRGADRNRTAAMAVRFTSHRLSAARTWPFHPGLVGTQFPPSRAKGCCSAGHERHGR